MALRFQADADFDQDIVRGIIRQQPEIDFQSATTAGLEGLSDLDVLALAANQGRVLVTHDRKTMPQYFSEFIIRNTSPGVLIVSRKLSIRDTIEYLILIWTASDENEWLNRIAAIPL
ncbi:MAG: DUF5615 family PIN-like protein [Chroococcidiopsidaceae cyanobacterium CP_BM_ER_R8_30]|nr:DUF5615 family PIN-like protein [Chroococcidiopsidaceae cyanobacterium CP_BM_ER_R8_30]